MLVFAIMLLLALLATLLACIAASPLFRAMTRAIDSCADDAEPHGRR
jgi:hypothetical protein